MKLIRAGLRGAILVGTLATTLTMAVNSAGAEVTLRLANSAAASTTWGQTADYFAERVSELTNGEVNINVVHGGALGSIMENLEAMQIGTLDMTITAFSWVSNWVPAAGLFEAPFLWDDYEHYRRAVIEGEAGEEMSRIFLEEGGLRVVAWANAGDRHILLRSPITTLDDLAGIKIRSPASEVYLEALSLMGAEPTPTDWTEVYTALQTGVVDGVENSFSFLYGSRLHEPAKHLYLTGHIAVPSAIFIAEPVWQRLDPEHQAALLQAGEEASYYDLEILVRDEEIMLDRMKEDGVQVSDLDVSAVAEIAEEFHHSFAERLGVTELLQKIYAYR